MRVTRTRLMQAGLLAVMAAGIALVIALVVWHTGRGGDTSRADASDPELVALGATVYAEHCAACHGERLEGEPNWRQRKADGTLPAPPHDATGHTWHHSDDLLFRLTRDGPATVAGSDYQSTMPAYRDILSERETWAVIAYIKSRWPDDIREAQARL